MPRVLAAKRVPGKIGMNGGGRAVGTEEWCGRAGEPENR
jgi:hypothetical protein